MSTGPDFDIKERVKQASEIVDLVGSYLELRRQGSNYVAHCPWHDDQKPSLQINPARQSWVCWVCNFRGDVFDFVMRREGLEFYDALKFLAERAGIEIKQTQRKFEKGSPNDKGTLYGAMAWAEQRFHNFLLESSEAKLVRDYLADRGITEDSVQQFQIGFAPLKWSWLVDESSRTEFSPEVLEACGLVSANQNGGWYERFRGRVIFPIRDTLQRPIAFGGRLVPGVFPADKEPPGKYINSPETRLFSKSDQLYGLNLVRDTVSRSRKLTIVEGYTDVIAAWQAGLRNVVAALGTALNDRHIRLIKRFADEITLVLDGDAAGQRRTNEILDLFVAQDVDLRILSLPEGLDPFDFLRDNGADPFQEMIDGASDAIAHKIRSETDGVDLINETHRANQALENILSTIARIPTSMLSGSAAKVMRQDQLLTRLARSFHIDRKQIKERLIEIRSKMSRTPSFSQETPKETVIDPSSLDRKERELVQLLVCEPQLLDTAIENIAPDQFVDGPLRQIFELMCECSHEGIDVGYQELMLQIEEPQLKMLIDGLHDESEKKQAALNAIKDETPNPDQLLADLIDTFNEIAAETGSRQTISRLEQHGLSDEEEIAALEELLRQARERRQ